MAGSKKMAFQKGSKGGTIVSSPPLAASDGT